MVMSRGYDPFIVFSFSKRECEGLAVSLAGLDLNSPDEAALVEGVFRWGEGPQGVLLLWWPWPDVTVLGQALTPGTH
jgi:hypothetical protein